MGVLDRETAPVVVEIGPNSRGATRLNARRPDGQLLRRVVVPVPLLHAVKADIDLIGSLDQLVRQPGPAARAEDRSRVPKGRVDALIPPRAMPEFHHVA